MTADPTPPPQDRKPNPDARPPQGGGGRSRRRSGRGSGRSRQGAPGGPAQGGQSPEGQAGAPEVRPARQAGGAPQGAPGAGGAGGRQTQGPGEGRPRQQPRDGGRRQGEGGRGEGGRPAGGRPQQGQQGQPGRASQPQEPRSRRKEAEPEAAPDLLDWAFNHLGYTAWIAHAQIQSAQNPGRALRSYVVDVHVGEDAVNPRLWPAILPFLGLEVCVSDVDKGTRALAEAFRQKAAELGLPPAEEYLKILPPAEETVSSPVQAALDTAMPLDMDHPQEDIDVMNEGRKGVRLIQPS